MEPGSPSLSLEHIREAHRRIGDVLVNTPCAPSIALSELTGVTLFCKMDNLQRTGSFKERGARNALLQLGADARERGVIAASAGNHALGLSYHGKLLGIPVTVVMPEFAPFIKVKTCRELGARVVLQGDGFSEARAEAFRRVETEGLTYINGYDDLDIIAGQGTMALEILEAVPNLDAAIIPIGGGGLIAGMATVFKALKPDMQVIGVESSRIPSWSAAVKAGGPVRLPAASTLADGLAVQEVGPQAFTIARPRIDTVLQVEEDQIALAILRFLEIEKSVVEGAAATPLAALLSGLCPELAGKRVVLPLCGGNIDPNVISRVIEKGLVADGRICRFSATISDRPGGLARFSAAISEAGAAIRDIFHDRAFSGPDVAAVQVLCIVETRDHDHIEELMTRLRTTGFVVRER